MDLAKLREQIDGIDARIVELYEERMEVCRQVAEYKIDREKGFRQGKGGREAAEGKIPYPQ